MPVLRAEMYDEEEDLVLLHNRLLSSHGAAAVARGWVSVILAACEETDSWGPEPSRDAVTVRSEMFGSLLTALGEQGRDSHVERAAAVVIATVEDPTKWYRALRAEGLSDQDAAWGLSRFAVAAANTVAVLLEGRGSWPLPDGHVSAEDERDAARSDALARIADRAGAAER
jgi:hypothetical protein